MVPRMLVEKKRERGGWDDWSVSLYILARSKTISISDAAKAEMTDCQNLNVFNYYFL